MGIITRKPPRIETIGAQYICFNVQDEIGDWTKQFEEEVERSQVLKSVKVSENSENTDVYASGEVYDTDKGNAPTTIEGDAVAFSAETLARMRGETAEENGLFLDGEKDEGRPYFAYGRVVKLTGAHMRMEWYPKCKLTENSDEASTKEEKAAEQTKTYTIAAYPFDGKNKRTYVDSSAKNFPQGLTEAMFFAKPVLDKAGLDEIIGGIA